MAEQKSDHDKAREMAEKALDKYVEGKEAEGDKLVQQAEKIDPKAIDEVADDLDITDEDIDQTKSTEKDAGQK
jgi:predicted RNase H-like HicB family nuclease